MNVGIYDPKVWGWIEAIRGQLVKGAWKPKVF